MPNFIIIPPYMQSQSHHYQLKLPYQRYIEMGRSFDNCQIEHYFILRLIGSGNYGDIYQGWDEKEGKIVAFKISQEISPKIKQVRERLTATEPLLMMACQSDHIVKCFAVYRNKELVVMVIEHCNGPTLQAVITDRGRIPEKEAVAIMRQLIKGIAEMHRQRIIHRDLKAQNILQNDGVFKIGDLGFSKQMADEEEVKQTSLGSLPTMAPQVLERQPYGVKADIWSLGVIFYQMIFGLLPFSSRAPNKILQQIRSKKILPEDLNTEDEELPPLSPQVSNFIKDVLKEDPKERLGWQQLLEHPLFKEKQSLADMNHVRKSKNGLEFQQFQGDQMQNEVLKRSEMLLKPGREEVTIRKSSASQGDIRKSSVAKKQEEERALHKWVREAHLQCLKTELIFKELVQRIIQHRLFPLDDRDAIELIFLMLTRAYNNLSLINNRLKTEKHPFLDTLRETVTGLYRKVTPLREEYSQKLTEIQNSVGSIIYDRIYRTINSESYNTRESFLTGIENIDYNKPGQIRYTAQYIEILIGNLRPSEGVDLPYIRKLLQKYVEINELTPDKVQESKMSFIQYIKKRLLQ